MNSVYFIRTLHWNIPVAPLWRSYFILGRGEVRSPALGAVRDLLNKDQVFSAVQNGWFRIM